MQARNPVRSWLLLGAAASVLVALVVPLQGLTPALVAIENSQGKQEAHRFPPVGLLHLMLRLGSRC